jgi:hypothetical protein
VAAQSGVKLAAVAVRLHRDAEVTYRL